MTDPAIRKRKSTTKDAPPVPKLRGDHDLHVDMDRLDLLKGIMAMLKDMVDEVTLTFSDQGLRFVTMDRMNISLVQCHLQSELFSTFKCQEPVSLCISVDQMVAYLDSGSASDMVRFTYKRDKETSDGTLVVYVFGTVRARFVANTLAYTDTPELELPALSAFEMELGITTADLNTACQNLRRFGEFAVFKCGKQGNLDVSTTGTKTQKASFDVPVQGPVKKDYHGAFNLEHLTRILKAGTLRSMHGTMRLMLSQDMPMCAQFFIGDVYSESQLVFFLAPRVED